MLTLVGLSTITSESGSDAHRQWSPLGTGLVSQISWDFASPYPPSPAHPTPTPFPHAVPVRRQPGAGDKPNQEVVVVSQVISVLSIGTRRPSCLKPPRLSTRQAKKRDEQRKPATNERVSEGCLTKSSHINQAESSQQHHTVKPWSATAAARTSDFDGSKHVWKRTYVWDASKYLPGVTRKINR